MKRIHYLNAFSGVSQAIANIVLTFLIVPVFIRKLGLETYGIYALVSAIGNLGVFTNFGFNLTVVKYLAEQRDRAESGYDIVVPLILTGATAVLVASACLVFRDFVLLRVMNIPAHAVDSSVYFFYGCCVVSTVIVILGQIPSAVLDSQQKVYVPNAVNLGVGVLGKILILGSLLIAPDLRWIGAITLLTTGTSMVLLTWFARKTWGPLRVPDLKNRFIPVVRKHLVYGRAIYATAITQFFYEPVTKVLMSHYLGLAEVGFFDMAVKVKGVALSVTERLLYPVLPLLASKEHDHEAKAVHDEVQRKLTMMIIPAVIAIAFMAKPAVSLWLGSTLWPVIVGVACIVNCFLFAQIFAPLYEYLLVKGHPEKPFLMQCVNAGLNIVLFLICVPVWGFYGAVLAFAGAVLGSTGLAVWFQRSVLGGRFAASSEFFVKLSKLSVGLLAVNLLSTWLVSGNLPRLSVLVVVNGVATVLLFRMLDLISHSDIERYVGRDNRAGAVLERFLIRGTS